jgi:subtilisin family serine protease
MTNAVAIHVEDEKEWQEEIQTDIERSQLLYFREIIVKTSLEEVRGYLKLVSGPVVIILDLRLGGDNPNYKGYHWILEELEHFIGQNARTAVFVVSGQLNEGITETLIRRGIPEEHIFSKGDWPKERDRFVHAVKYAVDNMHKIAFRNISHGVSGKNIDTHLIHAFQEIQEGAATNEFQLGGEIILPMLIRTKSNNWDYNSVPDLTVLGQINNIYSCLGSLKTVASLERDTDVLAVESSRPGSGYECYQSVPFVKADIIQQQLQERGDKAIIAFIDSGIDVLHESFRDSSGQVTRILAVWDQRDSTGPVPEGMKLGTEHTETNINEYIRLGVVPPALTPGKSDHGTHVASIAAGKACGAFAGGLAPESKIIVVIPALDFIPGKPYSIGYSHSHLLALQYIKTVAQQRKLPVVINVSQGQNAGAHDGTSVLEKGFDGITNSGQEPGIVLVKSAGNERNQRGHAHILIASHAVEALSWESTAPYGRKEVIDLWFKASDVFKFRLVNPDKEESSLITLLRPSENGQFSSGNSYKIHYNRYDPDNGDSHVCISILAGEAAAIQTGAWRLDITSEQVKTDAGIHAWLERNNIRSTVFTNHISEEVTISIPGTANHIITVGAVGSSAPLRLANYSAYGPTRDNRKKPDLVAPGVNISAAESLSTNQVSEKTGTSMAAPHVSGAIALLFSYWQKQEGKIPNWQQFNSAQVHAAITQSVQFYNPHWNRGIGYGLLDVETLLRQLISTES